MKDTSPTELHEIENMLSSMVPCALPEQTTVQLESAMNEEIAACACDESGLNDLEKHLGQMAPATMRTDVLSRMVKAMDMWYEQVPEEEKVVSFGEAEAAKSSGRSRSGGMLAAAAAVAILGAVTALVMPRFSNGTDTGQLPVANRAPVDHATSDVHFSGNVEPRDAWIVPEATGHKVVNTMDRGLVMTADNTPHRCIQLQSIETIRLEDESGREIMIERPAVKYVLVPVETN